MKAKIAENAARKPPELKQPGAFLATARAQVDTDTSASASRIGIMRSIVSRVLRGETSRAAAAAKRQIEQSASRALAYTKANTAQPAGAVHRDAGEPDGRHRDANGWRVASSETRRVTHLAERTSFALAFVVHVVILIGEAANN